MNNFNCQHCKDCDACPDSENCELMAGRHHFIELEIVDDEVVDYEVFTELNGERLPDPMTEDTEENTCNPQ